MAAPNRAHAQIAGLIRKDWGRILAVLVRGLGDFALAEDCLQDAVMAALDNWPRKGLPQKGKGGKPGAKRES